MDLKNITPYLDFKKIMEEASTLPTEFSNNTKFSESLVGRGIFSIIRYFKQGIDLGRLEYLKRKLENEYFAGFLRFVALKNIDLKDPQDPEPQTKPDDGGQPPQDQSPEQGGENTNIICQILNYDWNDNNTKLAPHRTKFDQYIKELEQQLQNQQGFTPEQLAEMQILLNESKTGLKYSDIKIKINAEVFTELAKYCTQDGMTFSPDADPKESTIVGLLKRVEDFLNGDAKACPSYHLTDREESIIKRLSTCTNQPIKDACARIEKLRTGTPESSNYWKYDLVNEEVITSSINEHVPIEQILGDQLNTTDKASEKVDPWKYLQSKGITTIDQIDFQKCDVLWRKHDPDYRNGTSKMVSLQGIMKIQYAAARIIYRTKKTPTYQGITPSTGGGVDKTIDSGLRTAWERKIEVAKGNWNYFMNFDPSYKIDPFYAMNLQDAIRNDPKLSGTYDNMGPAIGPASNAAKADKIGIIPYEKGAWVEENTPAIVSVSYGNKEAYLVFAIKSVGGNTPPHIYKYLGNIDAPTILADEKIWKDAKFKSDLAKKYAAALKSPEYLTKGCKDFNAFVGITDFNNIDKYRINSIQFGSRNFYRYNNSAIAPTQNTHFVHVYIDNTTNPNNFADTPARLTAEQVKLYISSGNGANKAEITLATPIETSKEMSIRVGQFFTFQDDTWRKAYFPNWDSEILNYRDKTKALNEDPLNGLVKIKK